MKKMERREGVEEEKNNKKNTRILSFEERERSIKNNNKKHSAYDYTTAYD